MPTSSKRLIGWNLLLLAGLGTAPAAIGQEARTSRDGPGAFNHVETRATILEAKPDGTVVKKGEVVCKLDPTPVRSLLGAQSLATKAAEAALQHARMSLTVAESAVQTYEEGTYKQEFESAMGAVALAESDLKRAENRLDWSERMLERGNLSLGENISDKLGLQRAKFALEQAQTQVTVLRKFTKDKTVMQLKTAVELAGVTVLRQEQTQALEFARVESLQRQLQACEVKAPADGVVEFAPLIETGAVVRDGQLLFRVIPSAK